MKDLKSRLEAFDKEIEESSGKNFWSLEESPVYRVYLHHAILNENHEELEKFIDTYYPDHKALAMEEYNSLKPKIKKVNKEEAQAIFDKNGITLLRADVHFMDEDAIFTMLKLNEFTRSEKYTQEESVSYVHTYTDTDYILKTRDTIYLNVEDIYKEEVDTVFVAAKAQ